MWLRLPALHLSLSALLSARGGELSCIVIFASVAMVVSEGLYTDKLGPHIRTCLVLRWRVTRGDVIGCVCHRHAPRSLQDCPDQQDRAEIVWIMPGKEMAGGLVT